MCNPAQIVPAPSQKNKSLIWFVVESSTRFWANWLSPLSIPRFTTGKGKPLLFNDPVVHLSIRDAWYVAMLLLGAWLCLATPSWIQGAQSAWPKFIMLGIAVHQIVDFVVLMIRLSLFGSHDKYAPSHWSTVARIRKERTVIVLVICYLCTLMWFGVLYRALILMDPASVRVAPEYAAMTEGTRALALSLAGQTTVVYGAVAPISLLAVLLTGVQTIVGVFYIALAVASVMTVMTSSKD